jgi:hypothetical protein
MSEVHAEAIVVPSGEADRERFLSTFVAIFILLKAVVAFIRNGLTSDINHITLVFPTIELILVILLIVGWTYAWLGIRFYFFILCALLILFITELPNQLPTFSRLYFDALECLLIALLTFRNIPRLVALLAYSLLTLSFGYDFYCDFL